MIYKVIGLMSGSSLDGLDIAYVHLQEIGGNWTFEIKNTECLQYSIEWKLKLREAVNFNALEYQLLHVTYGHYVGEQVNYFIDKNNLHHRVDLVVSHGHTTFHYPQKLMTAQLGDGAAIAAETSLPVVTDLRAIDVAFGGQGAPVVPIGELLLLSGYDLYLNLGGIANISVKKSNTLDDIIAFDVCAANRILNMLAEEKELLFDDAGKLSASGNVNDQLLQKLNDLDYYLQPYPKSLANKFGTDIVYPVIKSFSISVEDSMRTYVEHIIIQIKNAIINCQLQPAHRKLLVTGGGAFNSFLINRLKEDLASLSITVTVPDADIINYKEAVIMALMGVLRWREEYNVLSSVTGAKRNSIGGALWLGTEA
ncbi:MAG: anhydro-N-acetylmuramic acid kinase [Chitinophagaceae bacterium]|nr:anhydro-N-acetylmuramic acid kinase [Chitinophagaceae bacterium]